MAPLLVEEYRFGRIRVGGVEYDRDVVFTPEKVLDASWWRREGHRLYWEDIAGYVEAARPRVVVVGTGHDGMVRVDVGVVEALKRRGVELVAAPTGEAVKVYNMLARRGERVLAALHLTC